MNQGGVVEVYGALSYYNNIYNRQFEGCVVTNAKGYTENNNDTIKAKHYERIQKLAKKFKDKHGTIICRELLGENDGNDTSFVPSKRTAEYYQNRPCEQFIKDACDIIDKELAILQQT